jgi:arginine decarboxylase
MTDYGLKTWANGDFIIENGKLCVNTQSKPSIIDIVKKFRENGKKGPILLRFPHLIDKQITFLHECFHNSIADFGYKGKFQAVFPLKVNQYPNFVKEAMKFGKQYHYGLEAGSKAEMIIAMSLANDKAPITMNGFKDEHMINLGFISAEMGHNTTIIIEGTNELETIIKIAKKRKSSPNIGLRIRLHSTGLGIWAKSGGIHSKFGLTSSELISAINMLKEADLIDKFTMIHFHIGSQISEISPVKKALREAGNIYAELRKMGAQNLGNINLGGGLAIEYSQSKHYLDKKYTIHEYANDVVFLLKEISAAKGVKEPNIFLESGRFISASHAMLVAPVLELFSSEFSEDLLNLKQTNPPLVQELYELYKSISKKNALEYLHDSTDHLESILTLFDLGYIDLQDRSNGEILVNLVRKKSMALLEDNHYSSLVNFKENIKEKYLVNFSLFQSLPDYWGLGQNFPIMPIHHLDKKPNVLASIWDITCDSDGEISGDQKNPLFLHEVDVTKEDYFIGFFLLGAYQETMGIDHNLFTHPNEATVYIDEDGFEITNVISAQSINDILEDLDYDMEAINELLKNKIMHSPNIDDDDRIKVYGEMMVYIKSNGYLKRLSS